jgi:hypothetical protein
MSTNTGKNRKPGTFVPGDPRINRKGRPKSFDQLRSLAISLANEPIKDREGNPIILDGHVVTAVEAVLRDMMRDKKQRKEFLEIAFGKVPENIDITSGGEKIIRVIYEDKEPTNDRNDD